MKVIAFTDHSVSLGVADGLSMERHAEQQKEIEKVQKELGTPSASCTPPKWRSRPMARWITRTSSWPALDLVLASLHTSLRQPREKVTERLINAIRNPHVDIIGHPTGRLIPDREGG